MKALILYTVPITVFRLQERDRVLSNLPALWQAACGSKSENSSLYDFALCTEQIAIY